MTTSNVIEVEGTPIERSVADGSHLVESARGLAALIESEASTIEKDGKVTDAVVEALRQEKLFWVGLPESAGGSGGDIVDFIEVIEELARADGSTGWVTMVNATAGVLMSGFLPAAGAAELYHGGSSALVAGHAAPVGKAVRVPGGYRVDGLWPFASGCDHASWFGVGFGFTDDQGQRLALYGAVPREQVEIVPNWDVTGLRGTGSHDIRLAQTFIPDHRVMDAYSLAPVRDESIFFLGKDAVAVAGHASVALGLAKRALQEIVSITEGKSRRGYPGTVDEYPVFRYEFAEADAKYQSARTYLVASFRAAQEQAAREGQVSSELRARMRQAATWAHHIAEDVVSFARIWAASQAFRNPSALGRVVRDNSVATQHLLIDNVTLVDAAASLLDEWKKR